MPWFVQAIETTICLPRREISTEYEGKKIFIRPATKDLYADVSICFEQGSSELESRKTVARFLNALAWAYRNPIHERPATGGTVRGRVGKNFINHGIGDIDLDCLPDISHDENKALALSLYRNALSVNSITSVGVELIRILEIQLGQNSEKIKNWFNEQLKNIQDVEWESVLPHDLEAKRRLTELQKEHSGLNVGNYLYKNTRNSSAHAANNPNDPHDPEHFDRLVEDLCVVWYLVEKFIEVEIGIESIYRQRPILPSMYTCMKLSGMLNAENKSEKNEEA